MNYVKTFAEILALALDGISSLEEIERTIENPRFMNQGDLAFPCFQLARTLRKSPVMFAQELSHQLQNRGSDTFKLIEAAGGYVNAFLNKAKTSKEVLTEILEKQNSYGIWLSVKIAL